MKIFIWIFTLTGLLLLSLAGYVGYSAYSLEGNGTKTTGTIIALNGTHPVVRFVTEEGERVTFESSFGSSSYKEQLGNDIDVVYRPDAPQQAELGGFFSQYLVPIILGIMGLVFTLIGIIPALVIRSRGKKKIRLLHQGRPIKALITDVELNRSIEINGRSPFRIVCQWRNTLANELYIFTSENIYFDPRPYIEQQEIMVYIEAARDK
ncbi:DUF3592 domain-containing protein [Budviciaceae bacterium BWR-B9]|uniref:DUF3592 domain-containing protein n=1 Tax=Limnobaculum allomyrinae TaxID=2791986 RepID=A0ABS1INU6_9GAMM|nr:MULTISPECIES: DUF3592 domain-containing protein [Limnobaculum]MBK5142975.1 DUF3592 domain-containing protein [Limnobaculum allomyrinae]MBV7693304.1 DUF3592 domain-containing protein [Limnobaculum sp. M2-1]